MNPADSLPQDYSMYYHSTYMYHMGRGEIVRIYAEDGTLSVKPIRGGRWTKTEPEVLECWWPRAGSYNTGGNAVFIGRRAMRSMKKSAHDHYYYQWGRAPEPVLTIMAEGPNFIPYEQARDALNKRVCKSVAISSDLILQYKAKDNFAVIYRGVEAGELENNRFIALFDGTPPAKRAEYKLVKEGIECI